MADQREAHVSFGLSFLERVLFGHRYSRSPTSGRRTMLPSRILKSPTRPTSIRTLCGAIAPVPVGCPQLETGAAVSEPPVTPLIFLPSWHSVCRRVQPVLFHYGLSK